MMACGLCGRICRSLDLATRIRWLRRFHLVSPGEIWVVMTEDEDGSQDLERR